MPFCWTTRVYWEDTDGGGVVYYANYLRFLERARTEWLRSLGHSQHELAHEAGLLFAVVSLEIEYRRPARLDDALLVTCRPQRAGAASLAFAQEVYRDAAGEPHSRAEAGPGLDPHALVASAEVRVACVDARTFRPRRLPAFILSALKRAQEPA